MPRDQQLWVAVLAMAVASLIAGITLLATDASMADHRWGYGLVAAGGLAAFAAVALLIRSAGGAPMPGSDATPRPASAAASAAARLASFVHEAEALLAWARDHRRTENGLVTAVNEWHERLLAYLRGQEQLGPDYATRLHRHDGLIQYSGSYREGMSEDRRTLIRDLGFDIQRLMQFMSELRQRRGP